MAKQRCPFCQNLVYTKRTDLVEVPPHTRQDDCKVAPSIDIHSF